MPKTRTTLTIDEGLLRSVKVRAARLGLGESEVIEQAIRREIGMDLFDSLWERNTLTEEDADRLALEAQHITRNKSS
ncbi:MAG: ribbon-helix-helix protein, CopG family [Acidimicrobiales bacterium]|nr:ribbon-helix-helix protein, CopG family [Acidimicrobiales bacterium]